MLDIGDDNSLTIERCKREADLGFTNFDYHSQELQQDYYAGCSGENNKGKYFPLRSMELSNASGCNYSGSKQDQRPS